MTEIDGGAGAKSGGSVVTSLRELAALEAARVRDLAEAAKRRHDDEKARADAEAAAHHASAVAEARRLEEEAARKAQRDRENDAALAAMRAAAIEEARIAAEHRARAEDAARAHEREIALLAARHRVTPQRARLVTILAATLAVASVGIAAYAIVHLRARTAAAQRAHDTEVELIAAAEAELRIAKDTMARLDAELAAARTDARAMRESIEQSRREIDALHATCGRAKTPAAPMGRAINRPRDGLGNGRCKPGDPLCGTIDAPVR